MELISKSLNSLSRIKFNRDYITLFCLLHGKRAEIFKERIVRSVISNSFFLVACAFGSTPDSKRACSHQA